MEREAQLNQERSKINNQKSEQAAQLDAQITHKLSIRDAEVAQLNQLNAVIENNQNTVNKLAS